MRTPYEKVSSFIRHKSLLDGATGVVVAVSGGPDSVALLDMLMVGVGAWGLGVGEECSTVAQLPTPNPQPPSPIPHLHIAHLDHMLRGRESAEDAEFVRALAGKFGLNVTISSVDVRAAAAERDRGIEETAREIRYEFLVRVAKEIGCDRIAVGHTMTDQAETFLMRLIRGAGSRGLAAMRPIRLLDGGTGRRGEGATGREGDGATGREGERASMVARNDVASSPRPRVAVSPRLPVSSAPLLIRPLLCITREEVEAYCRERKLEFRTDVTNRDPQYTRNRIRNEIIPAMTAINPRVAESLARAAENLASDQDALDSLSSTLLNNARTEGRNKDEGSQSDGASVAYSVAAILDQPPGMLRRMIIEALRLARVADGEISSTHVSDVETLLHSGASGKRISLPGALEVWREFNTLVVKHSAVDSPEYQIAISAVDPNVQAGEFSFSLRRGLPGAEYASVIEATRREKARIGFDWLAAALLDCLLPDHLIIRPRRPGERAHVIGQQRTKKLKNLMIDHRIPSSRRADWPIVTTPDGRYIWSPGLPPAAEFTALDESQPLAILRAAAI